MYPKNSVKTGFQDSPKQCQVQENKNSTDDAGKRLA